MSAREYTKGYELTKSRRQQYIELPQAKRTSRDVPCRPCVAAMMRTRGQGSKKRAADTCRGFMVDCTDKTSSQKAIMTCCECIVNGSVCGAPVHPKRHLQVLELKEAYVAAFGKPDGSPENIDWNDAAAACRGQDGKILSGIRALGSHEVENVEEDILQESRAWLEAKEKAMREAEEHDPGPPIHPEFLKYVGGEQEDVEMVNEAEEADEAGEAGEAMEVDGEN